MPSSLPFLCLSADLDHWIASTTATKWSNRCSDQQSGLHKTRWNNACSKSLDGGRASLQWTRCKLGWLSENCQKTLDASNVSTSILKIKLMLVSFLRKKERKERQTNLFLWKKKKRMPDANQSVFRQANIRKCTVCSSHFSASANFPLPFHLILVQTSRFFGQTFF